MWYVGGCGLVLLSAKETLVHVDAICRFIFLQPSGFGATQRNIAGELSLFSARPRVERPALAIGCDKHVFAARNLLAGDPGERCQLFTREMLTRKAVPQDSCTVHAKWTP